MTSTSLSLSGLVPPVGAGLAPPVLRTPIVRRHLQLEYSTRNLAPICEPTPTVSLSPLNATLTKYQGGPRTPNSLVVAQHAAPSTLRLLILTRSTNTHLTGRLPVSLNPLNATLTKYQGGPRAPNSLVVAQHAAPSTLRLLILPRSTNTHLTGRLPVSLNPLNATLTKTRGVLVES